MFTKTASSLILFWKTTKTLTSYLFKNPLSSSSEESEKIVGAPNHPSCYDLKSLEWDRRTTLVLSNTRKLNRDIFTN